MAENINYQYDVFISYSRKDSRFAKKLQLDLENKFKLIDKKFREHKKEIHIALDEEDIDSSEDLTKEIRNKLKISKHLILILSNEALKSDWVNKEINYFKLIRGDATEREIIILLLDLPEPITIKSFPSELVTDNVMPLGIDARKDLLEEQGTNFKKYYKVTILYQIYGKLLHVPYATLKDRQRLYERKIKRRTQFIYSLVFLFFLMIFGIVLIKSSKPELILKEKFPNLLKRQIYASAIADFGEVIVKGGDDGAIYLVSENSKIDSLQGLNGLIINTKIYQDHYLLAASLRSRQLLCWDLISKKNIWSFANVDSVPFISIAVNKKQDLIALGDEKGTLWLINSRLKVIDTLHSPDTKWGRIEDLDFSEDGTTLAFCYLNIAAGYYNLQNKDRKFIKGDKKIDIFASAMATENGIFYCGWVNKESLFYLFKNDKNQESVLSQSSSPYGKLIRINNTNKIITWITDGRFAIYNTATNKELAATYVSDKEGGFEGALFSLTYDQKTELIKAFTYNYIYIYEIRWKSIFGIGMKFGKYF